MATWSICPTVWLSACLSVCAYDTIPIYCTKMASLCSRIAHTPRVQRNEKRILINKQFKTKEQENIFGMGLLGLSWDANNSDPKKAPDVNVILQCMENSAQNAKRVRRIALPLINYRTSVHEYTYVCVCVWKNYFMWLPLKQLAQQFNPFLRHPKLTRVAN